MTDRTDDPAEPSRADELDLSGRMDRASAHLDPTGPDLAAVVRAADHVAAARRRRRSTALAAAAVAVVVGGGLTLALRDRPEQVVASRPETTTDPRTTDPTTTDPAWPTTEPPDPGPDEVPPTTRVLESGPTIPLGACDETFPVPATSIGLDTRITSYGNGQIRVELHNRSERDLVVLNGGRYVALAADGSVRTDLYEGMFGVTEESEDPPVAVRIPAGGRGEIRTPIMLVLSTAACPGLPSLYGPEPLRDHSFVYLLGIEGSDEVYATEPDTLTLNGDGSASCARPLDADGDCP